MLQPIILCGGAGTRLWPLSQPDHPKPFLPLLEGTSLFEHTLQRAAGFAPPLVVSHADHQNLVQQQCCNAGIKPSAILLEPQSQGTAAAITVAALHLKSTFDDAVLLVLPADLVIRDQSAFNSAIEAALPFAERGNFVTFGIVPTHPEPRFGYIETGNRLETDVYEMNRFTEKPALETATEWMKQQKYFWNSGIFLLPLGPLLDRLALEQAELTSACSKSLKLARTENETLFLHSASFATAPRLAFETAALEQHSGLMVKAHFDWSDAGTWQSLWELQAQGQQGNVTHGDVRVQESQGCYIHSSSKRISALGCEDLVVVETKDEILITTREAADKVRDFAPRRRE